MFAYSQKAPAAGYGADSRKLLQDTVKQVRDEMGIEYAKIGQCNEDCLAKRRKDESTYSSHVYGRNGFRVLMHGVLGRPDGRMVESVAAKSNNKLQGLRLNKELEPLDMSNANCQGALARPIAMYLFPIKEEFHGRRKQLAADTERYNRAQNAGRCSKDASDMQQEGEDDETHAKRPKFLQRERQSASMSAPDKKKRQAPQTRSQGERNAADAADVAVQRAIQQVPRGMERDANPNRASRKGRVQVPDRHHQPAAWLRQQATTMLNEITSKNSSPGMLRLLNKTDGLSGLPTYAANPKANAALHHAVKDRWL